MGGCTSSIIHAAAGRRRRKKKIISVPQVAIYVPSMRFPASSSSNSHDHLPKSIPIPMYLSRRIVSLRNQIALLAQHTTDGSAIKQLHQALQEYLSLLLGFTSNGLQHLVLDFKWKYLEDGRQDICLPNSWFEILSVLHMMATLTMTQANLHLITMDSATTSGRLLPADCMTHSVDLLLKAAGYLDFCVREVLHHLPPHLKTRLPKDLDENILDAISNQALAQVTEIQLGLAVESQNANLSVKRRLACEMLSYLGQAHCRLSEGNSNSSDEKKNLYFIKWKYLEAKAAAYYYHGLIIDKGSEASSHVSGLCCLLAAEELLTESKKACLSFCLAHPVTRPPPPWGAMKHLNKKIPETASKKSQMYGGYLLEHDKDNVERVVLAHLPEFELSLKPDDYEFPEIDSAWDMRPEDEDEQQSLKQHLKDCDLKES